MFMTSSKNTHWLKSQFLEDLRIDTCKGETRICVLLQESTPTDKLVEATMNRPLPLKPVLKLERRIPRPLKIVDVGCSSNKNVVGQK